MSHEQVPLFEIPGRSASQRDAWAMMEAKQRHAEIVDVEVPKLDRAIRAANGWIEYHTKMLVVDQRLCERRQKRARDVARRTQKLADWQQRRAELEDKRTDRLLDAQIIMRDAIHA